MSKLKLTAIVGGIVLVIVAVFIVIYIKNDNDLGKNPSLEIDNKESFKNIDYLKDKQTALYIAPDADGIEKDQKKGHAVFIDQKGEASGFQIDPVEYGGMATDGKKVMIEQSSTLSVLSESVQSITFGTAEYRGVKTGYLKETNQFYSIYNSGLSKKYDYEMLVRYSTDDHHFDSITIPHFVSAAGEDRDDLVLLTQDLVTSQFQLQTMKLEEGAKAEKVVDLKLQDAENLDGLSQVIADDTAYYFAVTNYKSENYEDILLYSVNKKTLKTKKIKLAEYRSVEDTENNLPLTFTASMHLYENNLYYMNGSGKILKYDVANDVVTKHMTVSHNPGRAAHHAQISFSKDRLFYVYEVPKKGYYLDEYNIITKEKLKSQKIKGLSKYVGTDPDVGITNLTSLKSK